MKGGDVNHSVTPSLSKELTYTLTSVCADMKFQGLSTEVGDGYPIIKFPPINMNLKFPTLPIAIRYFGFHCSLIFVSPTDQLLIINTKSDQKFGGTKKKVPP